jgi:hypothetical protein
MIRVRKAQVSQNLFYCIGLGPVAIMGQWLQLIKITWPRLQCSKSQPFGLSYILNYLFTVLTLLCVQCCTTFSCCKN